MKTSEGKGDGPTSVDEGGKDAGDNGSPKPSDSSAPDVGPRVRDSDTVKSLLAGDETTFASLVGSYHRSMIQMARLHVPSQAVAEEVAQEAWLALLQGLAGFRGKSSLKTWLFGILLNRARTRGKKESRSVPFSALNRDPDRPRAEDLANRLAQKNVAIENGLGPWLRGSWPGSPEDRVLSGEMRLCLEKAIGGLNPGQKVVLILRDIEGWTSGEVCDLLQITPENQRVRLHRARLKLRDSIEFQLTRGRDS